MTTVAVVIGQDFEEIEFIAPTDLLRRAGCEVTVISCDQLTVRGATGTQIIVDITLDAVGETVFDVVVLPGGPGVKMLRKNARLIEFIKKHADKPLCAICAAPLLLKDAGLLQAPYTAHFSTAAQLGDIDFTKRVVDNGNVVTSQGPGTAVDFALAVVAKICGAEKSAAIAKTICHGV